MQKNLPKYEQAMGAWERLAELRQKRERLKKFTYGNQWDDMVEDTDGTCTQEKNIVIRSGQRPVSMNVLRRTVRLLVGRFRTRCAENNVYATEAGSLAARNSLAELDARLFEDFIISGCAVQRVGAERRPGGEGVWIDNVDIRRFFVNSFNDPRGNDINLIGMVHTMNWPEVVNRFGRGSKAICGELAEVFRNNSTAHSIFESDPGQTTIDVMEIWSYEASQRRGNQNYEMEWRCRYVAADGTVLSTSTPAYPHRSHPFVVKFYPLIDGEVHSFIEDLVERQQAMNRMLTTFDASMAASAKGALLFPVGQLVGDISLEDIGALWARPDSVIPVSGTGSELPRQLITNNAASGIVPLIEMQIKLFEESSGINETILGRLPAGTTGSELYKSLMANANAGLTDIFDTFATFMAARDAKAAAAVKAKKD